VPTSATISPTDQRRIRDFADGDRRAQANGCVFSLPWTAVLPRGPGGIRQSVSLDVIICTTRSWPIIPPGDAGARPDQFPDDPYPFKHLCGCGVASSSSRGIARETEPEEDIFKYLDFVTLSSTADIVPLVGKPDPDQAGTRTDQCGPASRHQGVDRSAGMKVGKNHRRARSFSSLRHASTQWGDWVMRCAPSGSLHRPTPRRPTASRRCWKRKRNRRKIDEDTFAEAQALAENLLTWRPTRRSFCIRNIGTPASSASWPHAWWKVHKPSDHDVHG